MLSGRGLETGSKLSEGWSHTNFALGTGRSRSIERVSFGKRLLVWKYIDGEIVFNILRMFYYCQYIVLLQSYLTAASKLLSRWTLALPVDLRGGIPDFRRSPSHLGGVWTGIALGVRANSPSLFLDILWQSLSVLSPTSFEVISQTLAAAFIGPW